MRPGRRPAARALPHGWRVGAFAAGSVAAHLLVVAALVLRWPGADPPNPPAPTPETGTVEVVMVQQPDAPAGQVQAAPAPAPPDDGVAPPRPPAPPAVNLGTDPSEAWSVRSDTLKPPAPDARYRNLPPRYPAEAAQRGEAGTVGLVVHVGADGLAEGAEIVEPSGSPALDREARRAVLLWHFDPALRGGIAVPFDYPIAIHFTKDR